MSGIKTQVPIKTNFDPNILGKPYNQIQSKKIPRKQYGCSQGIERFDFDGSGKKRFKISWKGEENKEKNFWVLQSSHCTGRLSKSCSKNRKRKEEEKKD